LGTHIFAAALAMGLLTSPAQAAGLPLVISATVDYSQKTLNINGQNFGSSSSVSLNSITFPTLSSASSQIVAKFPDGAPPSSFVPGTYFLMIQSRNQLPAIFTVDIGANGAPGPAGPQGPSGLQGVPGTPGPQGLVGSMGPSGATGAVGATGATGSTGLAGTQGFKGDTGAQGPKGDTGPSGTGAGIPTCTAPNIYLVISNGTLACQPQYVDNGDGTVTDNRTGLMWEKKIEGTVNPGNVHDVNNGYTWSVASSVADGTLFTGFIAGLNQGAGNGPTSCFADHCDWRIPTIVELKGILDFVAPQPSMPLIDPTFGPTKNDFYWSSSSDASALEKAWNVDFGVFAGTYGFSGSLLKLYPGFARAVRGGR
jgi:hypothetical protein